MGPARVRFVLVSAVALALILSGCGGTLSSSPASQATTTATPAPSPAPTPTPMPTPTPTPTPTPPPPPPSPPPPPPPQTIVYVGNETSGNISAFMMDATTGSLTTFSGSPFSVGSHVGNLTLSPGRHFLFGFTNGICCDFSQALPNLVRAQISAEGQLSTFSGELLPQGHAEEQFINSSNGQTVLAAVHPTRDFVYRFDQGTLWISGFDAAGNLSSEKVAFTFPADGCPQNFVPVGFASDTPEPSLIVIDYNFTSGCTTSKLGILSLNADGTGNTYTQVANGISVEAAVHGSYLMASVTVLTGPTTASGDTKFYQVVGGRATALATCDMSVAWQCEFMTTMTVTSDGQLAFTSDGSPAGNIWTLRRIGGAVNAMKNPLATTDSRNTMALSLDEKFLLVAQTQASSIAVYAIGPDGSLTPVPGSPFVTGISPIGIVSLVRP